MKNLADRIEANAEAVSRDEGWFALKSLAFGPQSPTPLKVKVANNNSAWRRGWTMGCQSYAKDLTAAGRRRFSENCQNPMTIDSDALPKANRAAIRESGALLEVAVIGPILDDLDAPLPRDIQKTYEIESEMLPESLKKLYVRRPDGRYAIPLSTEPPAEWLCTDDQVYRLLKFDDFVNDIGEAHRLLVEEGSRALEDDIQNLQSGSGTPASGTT